MILAFGGDSDMAIEAEKHFRIHRSQCDVRSYAAVSRNIKIHKPSVVICFAGVSHLQPIKGSDIVKWQDELMVNTYGSYLVAKACVDNHVPTMIFMGSVAGLYGKPGHSGYSASKAGVISLVQSLAMEGYNAYCISPGRVNTKMRERDFPGENPQTRLNTAVIAGVIGDILKGRYKPGDNIIIRKRGYRQLRRVDKGEPWKTYLQVGKPVVF